MIAKPLNTNSSKDDSEDFLAAKFIRDIFGVGNLFVGAVQLFLFYAYVQDVLPPSFFFFVIIVGMIIFAYSGQQLLTGHERGWYLGIIGLATAVFPWYIHILIPKFQKLLIFFSKEDLTLELVFKMILSQILFIFFGLAPLMVPPIGGFTFFTIYLILMIRYGVRFHSLKRSQ